MDKQTKSAFPRLTIFHWLLCLGLFTLYPFNSFCALPAICKTESFERVDTLPNVLSQNHSDLLGLRLKSEAARLVALHPMPETKKEWLIYRANLLREISRKAGVVIDHMIPLNMKETASVRMKGYSVRNIFFQTRTGVYATANLYVPDGSGKFPGVIVMMGHSLVGRLYDNYQSVGHTLALNGYVALCIDPWGAGERTTNHGIFEDHGDENNLGSSLLNIGEPLMGIEISDNIRGVDLLCSLPFVDTLHIGATGASGGGNQTMWLTAIDNRIKATVPVVSAGTFESYIMGTPCICEVLPGGLNLTEEAGILALIAPRAVKMCNHRQDRNQAFQPDEMIRSYHNAKPVFDFYGAEKNISFQIFDLTHGYFPEDREAMLGWFDLHLKGIGDGSPKKEAPFELLPPEKLIVFAKGERDPRVVNTEFYCKLRGSALRVNFLNTGSFNIALKKDQLREILGIKDIPRLKTIHPFADRNGWSRMALETTDGKFISVLIHLPSGNSKTFVILCNPEGKHKISTVLIDRLVTSGKGMAIVDLSGTGEVISNPNSSDKNGNLLTMTRTLLWFGKTVIGEWVSELEVVSDFLHSEYRADQVEADGNKEAGLAELFMAALTGKSGPVILRNAPVSYLFDSRENIDYFSMGINLPGLLKWGDVSLAAALTGGMVTFIDPVTMSGRKLSGSELDKYRFEFKKIRGLCNKQGNTSFIESGQNMETK